MATEIPQELTDKILNDLTDARNMDDIVMEVCEKTGLDWDDVEAYVNNLSAENENKITLAQSPLLVLLALSIFLLGVGIILNELYQAYQTYLSSSQGFVLEAARLRSFFVFFVVNVQEGETCYFSANWRRIRIPSAHPSRTPRLLGGHTDYTCNFRIVSTSSWSVVAMPAPRRRSPARAWAPRRSC